MGVSPPISTRLLRPAPPEANPPEHSFSPPLAPRDPQAVRICVGDAGCEVCGRQRGALTDGSLNEPRCKFRFGQIQRTLPSGEKLGLKVQIILQFLKQTSTQII